MSFMTEQCDFLDNFTLTGNRVNDKIRVAYYCFMLDADTAYKYAFGERDRELLAPFIEADQDYERKFMYRCMKVHFGCSEYRSFQRIFDKINREG
ncbi:MAG: hypothetical protein IJ794_00210 [Lachnospiraceae bacterium]|nr:hypothetical protein [Lachnospiraceae bacterium]